jgi:hypothetical protein
VRLRVLVLLLVLTAAPAAAQDNPPCQTVSPVRVAVTPHAGPVVHGTLLCLTATEVVLTSNGQMTKTALNDVRRIDTRADPAWDGAVKGAIIPMVMWAVFCHQCDAGPMLRMAAGYAAIGGIWDSLDRNQTQVYDRRAAVSASGPRLSIGWRLRF